MIHVLSVKNVKFKLNVLNYRVCFNYSFISLTVFAAEPPLMHCEAEPRNEQRRGCGEKGVLAGHRGVGEICFNNTTAMPEPLMRACCFLSLEPITRAVLRPAWMMRRTMNQLTSAFSRYRVFASDQFIRFMVRNVMLASCGLDKLPMETCCLGCWDAQNHRCKDGCTCT